SENHPPLQVSRCTKAGGCVSSTQSITLDANWRWLHNSQGSNCYTGNTWNQASCPDPLTCAQQCFLDSANYEGVYGITSSGNSLRLNFVTQSANKNVGSRNYLLNSAGTQYESFNLKGKEFTFTVDVSNLPCGLNGALYFSEMPADGGLSATNTAGAPYGTGYCDAQCPHDVKFIQGQANIVNWKPDSNNPNTGRGQWGSCCAELDVWEANSISEAYTPHVCSNAGLHKCVTAEDCGDGDNRHTGACDKDGCDFNPYRMGVSQFYGPGLVVDTTKPFTVVTQFLTTDGTSASDLVEIRRSFVQNGVVHGNPVSTFAPIPYDSVTDSYCAAQKSLFGD
ncbi:exo-cellobiohydrolase, partial [Chytriomyces sp. MP71]